MEDAECATKVRSDYMKMLDGYGIDKLSKKKKLRKDINEGRGGEKNNRATTSTTGRTAGSVGDSLRAVGIVEEDKESFKEEDILLLNIY